MRSPRVLAVAEDLVQLRRLVSALERAGADVDAHRSASVAEGGSIPHRYVFVVVRGDDELRSLLPRLGPGCHLIVLGARELFPSLTRWLAEPRIDHVLCLDEIERAAFVSAQKLLTGDIFGLEPYLPAGTPVHYQRVRDRAGLDAALESVVDLLSERQVPPVVRARVAAACQELVVRALYEVPTADDGAPYFRDADPWSLRESSPRPVSLRFAISDASVVVAIRDRYGRTTKSSVADALEPDPRTALGRAAAAASQVVVNVAAEAATEVVCVFDRVADEAPSSNRDSRLGGIGVFVHAGDGLLAASRAESSSAVERG